MYDPLHEVCWHEAGHGVMAHIHKMDSKKIWVYQDSDGNWGGYHGSYRSSKEQNLDVLAAGLAGGLLYLKDIGERGNEKLVEYAFDQSFHDRKNYLLLQGEDGDNSSFYRWCEKRCLPVLEQKLDILHDMANELISYKQIGSRVFDAIIERRYITQDQRDDDNSIIKLCMRVMAMSSLAK